MVRSFRTRLIILFAGLAGGVLLVSLLTVWLATNNQLNRTVARELAVSERVLSELLDQRAQQLRQSAQVLADDFGFRQAVASGDEDTIISALINQGERIGTDLMVLQNTAGDTLAATHDLSTMTALQSLLQNNGGESFAKAEGQLYQLIAVPVRAPDLIAWVILGFQIDAALVDQLQGLANADVTFYEANSQTVLASSMSAPLIESFAQLMLTADDAAMQASFANWLAEAKQAGQSLPLQTLGDTQLLAVLSTDLDSAGAEFAQLRMQYLLIAILTLLIALVLAVFTARRINQPLQRLIGAAEKLRSGDYNEPINAASQDEFGQLARTFDDMRTAVAEREQRIRYQAEHDMLTELPNRRAFQQQLVGLLKAQTTGAVALLNINRFRELNDSLGQQICDQLLQLLARRLRNWRQSDWYLARLAGDEFVLLHKRSESLADEPDYGEAIEAKIADLIQVLQQPWALDGTQYLLRFSAGVVYFPEHGNEVDSLVRRAQISRGHAKQTKQLLKRYELGMDEHHMQQLRILRYLPEAVEQQQLSLHFQPKVNCQTGVVVGAEALLRWHHPELGAVRPDIFIGLAEQAGEITRITRWVCLEVIKQVLVWQQQGLRLQIAINISAVDLMSDGLADFLGNAITSSGVDPQLLTLEVTESALMQDPEAAIARLERLRGLGLKISIDDYGTGYSSLAQLKRLPVDELKIDRSFIQFLEQNEHDRLIVKSTLALAHDFGLTAVAEGVEQEATWHMLKQFGCDSLQGYYFSKPLALESFSQWLSERDTRVEG